MTSYNAINISAMVNIAMKNDMNENSKLNFCRCQGSDGPECSEAPGRVWQRSVHTVAQSTVEGGGKNSRREGQALHPFLQSQSGCKIAYSTPFT